MPGQYPTIQAAITAAVEGDIIDVEDGTYTGDGNRDIDFLGKAITVRGNVADPNLVVIDSQGTEGQPHRGFKFVSGEDDYSVLEGFTITNGYGPKETYGAGSYSFGGGIFCRGSSPTIQNCIITGNIADYVGGGVHGCAGTIQNCTIIGNSATFGGGIAHPATIQDCIISGNSANTGGGLYGWISGYVSTIQNCTISNNIANGGAGISHCSALIQDCTIKGNHSLNADGGGISEGSGIIRNCIIKENSSRNGGGIYDFEGIIQNCIISMNTSYYGAGIYHHHDEPLIIEHSTIIGNSANSWGGGIYTHEHSDLPSIRNCIVWGNTASLYPQLYGSSQVSYSCIQDWDGSGTGNINEAPLFVDATNGDYHLLIDSPCIDSGDPLFIFDPNQLDIDGHFRVIGGRVDIGGDEFFADDSAALFLSLNTMEFTAEGIDSAVSPQIFQVYNYGAYDLNWSVVNDCEWLSVSPTSGQSGSLQSDEITIGIDHGYINYGIQFCQFQIIDANAANSPQTVTVTLDVLRPEMNLSESSFSFTGDTINPPQPQVLTIQNTGYDTLNWTITEPTPCDWLTVTPESGQTTNQTPADAALSVDPALVGYGLHTCQLNIHDPNAGNSPQTVTVTLEVLPPEIGVSPTSPNFECDVDEPNVLTQVLSISNSGYDTLNWQIEMTGDCDWLSIEPVSGQCTTGPNEVTLTVNTEGLDIGTYPCDLTITDDNASNSPRKVTVSLHVYRDGERHVPMEYSAIQAALNAAVNGDHVIIHPGRYAEGIAIPDKQLTIRSVAPNDPVCIHSTIIKSTMRTNQLVIVNPVAIEGLSFISNQIYAVDYGYGGSGLYFWETTAQIRNCIFKNWQEGGILCHGFSGDILIENCLFEGNGIAGVHILYRTENAFVEINNCTIVDTLPDPHPGAHSTDIAGIRMDGYNNNHLYIRNSILSNYVSEGDAEIAFTWANSNEMNSVDISNSCIPAGPNSITIVDPNYVDVTYGPGNIEEDPLFVLRGYRDDNGTPTYDYDDVWVDGDYHLKSQAGRFLWEGFARADFNLDKQVDLIDFGEMAQNWEISIAGVPPGYPWNDCDLDRDLSTGLGDLVLFCDDYLQPRVFGAWVADEVTSPCVDTGDPNDIRWQNELWPHGERINMGAYGGTPQASMSPNPVGNTADLNHDGRIDLADWSLWADDWQKQKILLDSDFDRNNHVNPNDLNVFINNWLEDME